MKRNVVVSAGLKSGLTDFLADVLPGSVHGGSVALVSASTALAALREVAPDKVGPAPVSSTYRQNDAVVDLEKLRIQFAREHGLNESQVRFTGGLMLQSFAPREFEALSTQISRHGQEELFGTLSSSDMGRSQDGLAHHARALQSPAPMSPDTELVNSRDALPRLAVMGYSVKQVKISHAGTGLVEIALGPKLLSAYDDPTAYTRQQLHKASDRVVFHALTPRQQHDAIATLASFSGIYEKWHSKRHQTDLNLQYVASDFFAWALRRKYDYGYPSFRRERKWIEALCEDVKLKLNAGQASIAWPGQMKSVGSTTESDALNRQAKAAMPSKTSEQRKTKDAFQKSDWFVCPSGENVCCSGPIVSVKRKGNTLTVFQEVQPATVRRSVPAWNPLQISHLAGRVAHQVPQEKWPDLAQALGNYSGELPSNLHGKSVRIAYCDGTLTILPALELEMQSLSEMRGKREEVLFAELANAQRTGGVDQRIVFGREHGVNASAQSYDADIEIVAASAHHVLMKGSGKEMRSIAQRKLREGLSAKEFAAATDILQGGNAVFLKVQRAENRKPAYQLLNPWASQAESRIADVRKTWWKFWKSPSVPTASSLPVQNPPASCQSMQQSVVTNNFTLVGPQLVTEDRISPPVQAREDASSAEVTASRSDLLDRNSSDALSVQTSSYIGLRLLRSPIDTVSCKRSPVYGSFDDEGLWVLPSEDRERSFRGKQRVVYPQKDPDDFEGHAVIDELNEYQITRRTRENATISALIRPQCNAVNQTDEASSSQHALHRQLVSTIVGAVDQRDTDLTEKWKPLLDAHNHCIYEGMVVDHAQDALGENFLVQRVLQDSPQGLVTPLYVLHDTKQLKGVPAVGDYVRIATSQRTPEGRVPVQSARPPYYNPNNSVCELRL